MAIVPVMGWLGVPLMTAKPTGLFINTLSMLSATLKNIRHGKLDVRFGLPILIVTRLFLRLVHTPGSSYLVALSLSFSCSSCFTQAR
ncbi:hypothetical protein [Thermococcus sp. MAR1]|uniref:hypothetical protein n=1 Tax=Thermococcus sp. MAR1 TaxID=1638263 RepID=UPI003519EBB4